MSMRKLILWAMILCVTLFAAVGVIGLNNLNRSYYDEFARGQRELSESYYHYIKRCMDEISRFSLRIIADESVQTALREIRENTGIRQAQGRTDMQNAVTASMADVTFLGYVQSVVVYDCFGNPYSYGGMLHNETLQAALQDLAARTEDTGSADWHTITWEEQPYLVLTRAIRESKNLSLDVLGYELIMIDFQRLITQAETHENEYARGMATYLDGVLFYRGSECPETSAVPEEAWTIDTVGGTKYFISTARFLDQRLTMASYANYSRLTGVLQNAWRSLILLLILLVLFCIGFFELVTRRVFRRLEGLTEAVRGAPEGDYRVTLAEDLLQAGGEVGVLARQFQHLMNQIDDLIHRELQGKLTATMAKCRMLQAQIHPHFLYNTLETIYAIAERDQNRQIARMTMSLSRLVRASFRDGMIVPLEREISLVREYLSIYRIRFGSRLSATIEYDPDDDGVMLPQMTLQPLVENSVRYGLMKKMSRGTIRLRVRHSGGFLKISLYDNGVGLTPEQVEEYNHLQPSDEMNAHGFQNVIYRLKYTYGDRAYATIRSRKDCWTNLALTIPDTVPETMLKEAE